jgi:hypothetical protein
MACDKSRLAIPRIWTSLYTNTLKGSVSVMRKAYGKVWTDVKGLVNDLGVKLDVWEWDFPADFDFGDQVKPGEKADGVMFYEEKKRKITLVVRPVISADQTKRLIERIHSLAMKQACLV